VAAAGYKGRTKHRFRLGIMHLTFEGVQTWGGGVATVTRAHLRTTPIIAKALRNHGIDLTMHLGDIAYAQDHERYDPGGRDWAVRQVAKTGGKLFLVPNRSQGRLEFAQWGEGDWGSLENWRTASVGGATLALNLAREYDAFVVFAHDTPYALVNLYGTLQSEAFGVDLTCVYVVHSSALTHELPLPAPERLMAESLAMHWTKVTPKARLGSISRFMADHISRDYGVPPENIIPTRNGVEPKDPIFANRSTKAIAEQLARFGVPTDVPLLFSWGRAVEYKRFDVFLKAAALLRGRVHAVIVCSPEAPELVALDRKLKTGASLIFRFDPELVASMLQWPKTVVAGSLARLEPCGLTPAELRVHARERGPILIVSDTGGLPEQVTDGVDGFVTRQDDEKHVARVISSILDLPESKKRRIRKAGYKTILRRYTWRSNILESLAAVVPQVQAVRSQATKEVLAGLEEI
jgi:glycosyltransferase involved in cell wall biosynthesis